MNLLGAVEYTELNKLAASRYGKELNKLNLAAQTDPSILNTRQYGVLNHLKNEGRTGEGFFPSYGSTPLSQGTLGYTYATTPMKAADRMNQIKELISGRHAPRPNDYVIPGTVTAEETANYYPGKASNDKYIFRAGNDLPHAQRNGLNQNAEVFYSRHPDVAINYGMGRRGDGSGPKNGRELTRPFKAYLQDSLTNPRTQRAGSLLGPSSWDTPAMFSLENAKKLISNYGPHNPTYETIAPMAKPIGEYGARMVRLANGLPGFALNRVSGAPIAQAFKNHLIQQPSMLSNIMGGIRKLLLRR